VGADLPTQIVDILGFTRAGEKPGFFLNTALPHQYFSHKPGF
jgi:hypothetical protein